MINLLQSHYLPLNCLSLHGVIQFGFLVYLNCKLSHALFVVTNVYHCVCSLADGLPNLVVIKTPIWRMRRRPLTILGLVKTWRSGLSRYFGMVPVNAQRYHGVATFARVCIFVLLSSVSVKLYVGVRCCTWLWPQFMVKASTCWWFGIAWLGDCLMSLFGVVVGWVIGFVDGVGSSCGSVGALVELGFAAFEHCLQFGCLFLTVYPSSHHKICIISEALRLLVSYRCTSSSWEKFAILLSQTVCFYPSWMYLWATWKTHWRFLIEKFFADILERVFAAHYSIVCTRLASW